MPVLKFQEIQSNIRDLEASRNNQYNRYLVSGISVIIEVLVKSKDKIHGERFKEIQLICLLFFVWLKIFLKYYIIIK